MATDRQEKRKDNILVQFLMKKATWDRLVRRRQHLGLGSELAVIGRALALYEHLHEIKEANGAFKLQVQLPLGKVIDVPFE